MHVENAVKCSFPTSRRIPDLTDDRGLRFCFMRRRGESAKEYGPEVACDIESPTVDAIVEVRAHDAVRIAPQVRADILVLKPKIRKVRDIRPTTIAMRILAPDEEPVAIRARCIRA